MNEPPSTPIQRGGFDEAVSLLGVDFSLTPRHWRGRTHGLEYLRLDEPDGGVLWVTRLGWPRLCYLLPDRWYTDKLYAKKGERLTNATSTAYRVTSTPNDHAPMDLVVKFARFAQDVPIWITADKTDPAVVAAADGARFNSPFQEFGRVMQLRRKRYEGGIPIKTGRPLAVYSPGQTRPAWQLGRNKSAFRAGVRDLDAHDATAQHDPHFFDLQLDREYVLLYEWLKGLDAEQAMDAGLLTAQDLADMTDRVTAELTANGFLVVDNKPKHYILRQRRKDQSLIYRHGQLAYALIDFELLRPR